MTDYLYPVLNQKAGTDWVDVMLKDWKSSGKKCFIFAFAWFEPHTLPEIEDEKFWMYLYNTKGNTSDANINGIIKFRVRVIKHSTNLEMLDCGKCFINDLNNPDATMWFKCDLAAEISNHETHSGVTLGEFQHKGGKKLPSTIQNSIAPVILKNPSSILAKAI